MYFNLIPAHARSIFNITADKSSLLLSKNVSDFVQFTVTNTSGKTLTINKVLSSGNAIDAFNAKITTNTCLTTLGNNQTCTITSRLTAKSDSFTTDYDINICTFNGALCSGLKTKISVSAAPANINLKTGNDFSVFINGNQQIITINNPTTLTTGIVARNIKVSFPASWSDVTQDATACHQVAPGKSCQIIINSGREGHSRAQLSLSGDNTNRVYFYGKIRNDGYIKCWGWNGNGQLGLGDTADRGQGPGEMGNNLPLTAMGSQLKVTHLAAGFNSSCARLTNGRVKCWGGNSDGQLGLGDTTQRGDGPNEMGNNLPELDLGSNITVKQVLAGDLFACAITSNDKVKCWGRNFFGQLGLGDTEYRGNEPNEMGNQLPFVELGTGRTVSVLSLGANHVCALLDNHTIKCWGRNGEGDLGIGDIVNRGTLPGQMGNNLQTVDLGTNQTAIDVTLGVDHSCAILSSGQVKCWGRNVEGQLGQGDTTTRGNLPGTMGDNLAAIKLGKNRTAIAISAGFDHTCALLDNHKVKCWGKNTEGQLGLGDTTNRGNLPGQMGDNLPTVNLGSGRTAIAISANRDSTCALLDNNRVKCWGRNNEGQLGLGDMVNRGTAANQMGDNLPAVDLGSNYIPLDFSKGTHTRHFCMTLRPA